MGPEAPDLSPRIARMQGPLLSPPPPASSFKKCGEGRVAQTEFWSPDHAHGVHEVRVVRGGVCVHVCTFRKQGIVVCKPCVGCRGTKPHLASCPSAAGV